jgi:ATP-dependent DNA helicase RecQ
VPVFAPVQDDLENATKTVSSSSPGSAVVITPEVGVQMKLNKAMGFLKMIHGKDASWRDGQKELLTAMFQGKDAVGILPTAGGKGDVVLIVGLVMLSNARAKRKRDKDFDKPPLCVTMMLPTTALIEDMYERFLKVSTALNFTCCFLGSTQMDLTVSPRAANGEFDFILATSEKFSTFLPTATTGAKPGFHVLCEFYDEVHTLLDADSLYRPSMLDIKGRSMERVPAGPRIVRAAFTATAEETNLPTILELLPLKNPVTIRVDPRRENIALACCEKSIGRQALQKDCAIMYERIMATEGQYIIYTQTREETKRIVEALQECHGGKALATNYHGRLEPREKKANKLLWDTETVQVSNFCFLLSLHVFVFSQSYLSLFCPIGYGRHERFRPRCEQTQRPPRLPLRNLFDNAQLHAGDGTRRSR